MALLLVRATLHEIMSTRSRQRDESTECERNSMNAAVTNITENRLCEMTEQSSTGPVSNSTILSYKSEAENFALQHQV